MTGRGGGEKGGEDGVGIFLSAYYMIHPFPSPSLPHQISQPSNLLNLVIPSSATFPINSPPQSSPPVLLSILILHLIHSLPPFTHSLFIPLPSFTHCIFMLHLIHSPPPHPLPLTQSFLSALLSCIPLCPPTLLSLTHFFFLHLIHTLPPHSHPPVLSIPPYSTPHPSSTLLILHPLLNQSFLIPHSPSFTHLLLNPLPPLIYSLLNLLHPYLLAPISATPFSHPLKLFSLISFHPPPPHHYFFFSLN